MFFSVFTCALSLQTRSGAIFSRAARSRLPSPPPAHRRLRSSSCPSPTPQARVAAGDGKTLLDSSLCRSSASDGLVARSVRGQRLAEDGTKTVWGAVEDDDVAAGGHGDARQTFTRTIATPATNIFAARPAVLTLSHSTYAWARGMNKTWRSYRSTPVRFTRQHPFAACAAPASPAGPRMKPQQRRRLAGSRLR